MENTPGLLPVAVLELKQPEAVVRLAVSVSVLVTASVETSPGLLLVTVVELM
jgi:hypothetical protein